MGACSSCGARVLWATTVATRSAIPLDPEPVDVGTPGALVVVTQGPKRWAYGPKVLAILLLERLPDSKVADYPHHLSHFATCPNANTHRRKAKANA